MVVLSVALSSCESRDIASLRVEAERLRAERDRIVLVAEHIDLHKDASLRVSEDYKRLEYMSAYATHNERVERAREVLGVPFQQTVEGWEVAGNAVSLAALCTHDGALAVRKFTFLGAGSWTLVIPTTDIDGTFLGPMKWPSPPPLPPVRNRIGKEERELRERIEIYESDIAKLREIVSGIPDYPLVREDVERKLRHVSLPSRFGMLARVTSPLFIERDAPCESGSVVVQPDSVRLRCLPHSTSAAAIAEVRDRFAELPDWELRSLDVNAADANALRGEIAIRPSSVEGGWFRLPRPDCPPETPD